MPKSFCSIALSLAFYLIVALVTTLHPHASQAQMMIVEQSDYQQFEKIQMTVGTTRTLSFKEIPEEIIIANDKIVKINQTTANNFIIYGQKIGKTNLEFKGADGSLITFLTVSVGYNIDFIKQEIKKLNLSSTIEVSIYNNKIVLRGLVSSAEQKKQILLTVHTIINAEAESKLVLNPDGSSLLGSNIENGYLNIVDFLRINNNIQVGLKVVVVEIQKNFSDSLGITGSLSADISGLITKSISSSARSISYAASLQALQSAGLVKILANTTLTAISGKTSNFFVGDRYPIESSRDSDTNEISYTLEKIGIEISFTPIIYDAKRIILSVQTSNNEIGTVIGSTNRQSILERTSNSTIVLPSGGISAIAGLIKSKTSEDIKKFPFLGNLPFLGKLFQSREFKENKTELAIFVSPYIISTYGSQNLNAPQIIAKNKKNNPATKEEINQYNKEIRKKNLLGKNYVPPPPLNASGPEYFILGSFIE